MATDLERLVVSLEASTTKFERSMQRANAVTNTEMRKIEKRAEKAGLNVSGALGKAFAFAGGGAALGGAKQLLDANTRITNSLKVAGLEGEQLSKVYDQLAASAKRNGASFEALAGLYGRAALVQNELGVSAEDLTQFADNVAVALRVAGTDAQAASGALTQLSQALGAGTVRAEEFSSILEGAPTIAQAAAAGITEAGGSVAKLRQLVVDGKVSSDVFFRGFQLGAAGLREKAASSVLTIDQSFQSLQTTLVQAAGDFDRATGASAAFSADLYRLAAAVERLTDSRFVQWLSDVNRWIESSGYGPTLSNTIDEFERLGRFFDGLGDNGLRAFDGAEKLEHLDAAARNALAVMLGFENIDLVPPEQRARVDAFVALLGDAETSSDDLMQALRELGGLSVNFAVVDGLKGLRAELLATRSEAVATAAAVVAAAAGHSSGSNVEGQRREQLATRPRLAQQTASIKEGKPAGTGGARTSGSGGGGGGQSPLERFNEAMANQQREIDMLNRRTDAVACLGDQTASLNAMAEQLGLAA
ncbi:tape measure protein [Devosia sp. 1635]|uniref:tape measure protein n=1 Tax=Devosia sp. 1635 TaxID=2726066 RepID=UPI0015655A06|nr:tape measure protein [Devosia sp. 1635]